MQALRTSRHSAGMGWAAGAAASDASHSWKPRDSKPFTGLSAALCCASTTGVLRSWAWPASALALWPDPNPDPSALLRMGRSSKATAASWSSGTWQGQAISHLVYMHLVRYECSMSMLSPHMAGTQVHTFFLP